MILHSPDPFLIFDFVDQSNQPQHLIFSQPIKIISTDVVAQIDTTLREVREFVNQGYYVAGYLSYEAAPAFDPAFTVAGVPVLPLLWFGVFQHPDDKVEFCGEETFHAEPWEPVIGREQYSDAVKNIRDAIARGETYQVNYTIKLRSHVEGDLLAYYDHLREAQQAGYSAYLNIGRYQILSFSPELFFHLNGNEITTRPMKGTVQRGRWHEEDEVNVSWLRSSEKNRAENVMIVDLLRNDLSRIAEVGSVRASRLFEIERYPTVHQMTSTVSATVRPEVSWLEIFQALFPCGSITGAPKISTMRLIAELEKDSREVYCGAIGFIKPNGNATFNVAIRTMFVDSDTGTAEYGTGGGITWDSTDRDEYQETMTKAEFLRQASRSFQLLETLKFHGGEFVLFDRHMTRLEKSALYFGIPMDTNYILRSLHAHVEPFHAESRRVRLLISPNGAVHVESTVLHDLASASLPVCLAQTPISKENRFLYHKTTNRSIYESHRKQNDQVFDVLLWNENEEITEFTQGNIVAEIGNEQFTPPVECGLLPGTFRAQLLDDDIVKEQVLTVRDLQNAQQIWFINSVREWVLVHLT